MASIVMTVLLAPDLVQYQTVVCFDVKLRSGMKISDLTAQFMQNHDRIVPETIRKGRSGVKIRVIFDESWEIFDQAAGELTRHNRAMPHLGNWDRKAKPPQVATNDRAPLLRDGGQMCNSLARF